MEDAMEQPLYPPAFRVRRNSQTNNTTAYQFSEQPFISPIPPPSPTLGSSSKVAHYRSLGVFQAAHSRIIEKSLPPPLTKQQVDVFYPTPPPSPDLDEEVKPLPVESSDTVFREEDHRDFKEDYQRLERILTPPPSPSLASWSQDCISSVRPIPIQLQLSTAHHLPYASSLKLTPSTSLLGVLGGNRVLSTNSCSVWDRMPYSPVASSSTILPPLTKDQGEEDSVEKMLEMETAKGDIKATTKGSRHDHMNSIYVQPPTPERIGETSSLPKDDLPSNAIASTSSPNRQSSSLPPTPRAPSFASPETSPQPRSISRGTSNVLPLPLHGLAEVRSPPRRTIAMTQDSLQIIPKRGRRPRLFGFTEMPESGSSSANSSRDNSRSNSPDRKPTFNHLNGELKFDTGDCPTPTQSSVHNGLVLPRRGPSRTKSDTHLPSIAVSIATATPRLNNPSPSSSNAASPSRPNFDRAASHTPSAAPRRTRDNTLKLDFSQIIPLPKPEDTSNAYVPSPYSAKLIRKKSGEILKPALKYGGPLSAAGTPISESGPFSGDGSAPSSPDARPRARFGGSKSLPSTPSCPKYVHFDAQLEKVKLFKKEQKPEIVSRNGSPTQYGNSEGEEYPFPSTDEDVKKDTKKVLHIKLPNFPSVHPPESDLHLESLLLDDDRRALKGVVKCRNFAFSKWVAVRFTFDWWQTTSEVSATYKESIKDGSFDRFTFQIKLDDMMARIEEKTLFLCVRYNSDGRELWDSNNGSNYQVIFEKVVPKASNSASASGKGKVSGGKSSQWSLTKGSKDDDRMKDLKDKLSRLTADDNEDIPLSPNRTITSFLSPGSGKRSATYGGSPSSSPRRSAMKLDDDKDEGIPTSPSKLAGRYDFGLALKGARDRRGSLSPNKGTFDLPGVPGPQGGSPKPSLLAFGGQPYINATVRQTPSPQPASTDSFFSPQSPSKGVVDSPQPISIPTVKPQLLVPELKVQGPSPTNNETSPLQSGRPLLFRSITSPAVLPQKQTNSPDLSSTHVKLSPSSSPIPSPARSSSPSPPHLTSGGSTDMSDSPQSPPDMSLSKYTGDRRNSQDSSSSYSSFIEQFCWAGAGQSPPHDGPRRVHSTSSLDQYFSQTPSPPVHHHTSSFDFSGFTTPRATPHSRSVTPSSLTTGGGSNNTSFYSAHSNFSPLGGSPVKSSSIKHREDVDVRGIENAARALGLFSVGAGRVNGSGIGGLPGNMSPPVKAV